MWDKIRVALLSPAIPAEKVGTQWPFDKIAAHYFLRHDCARYDPPPHRVFFAAPTALPALEQTVPSGNFPAGANPPIPASRYSRRPPDSPVVPPSIPIFPDRECLDGIIRPAPLAPMPA